MQVEFQTYRFSREFCKRAGTLVIVCAVASGCADESIGGLRSGNGAGVLNFATDRQTVRMNLA
jgi:hypothetical protein